MRPPLGILAGGGGLPTELAEHMVRCGRSVHIVGLRGEASEAIAAFPHAWVPWGGVDAMLSSFRRAGARELVVIGHVRRPALSRIRPDLGLVRALPTVLGMLTGGDDSVLRAAVRFIEGEGFAVRSVADVAPEFLAPAGPLGAVPMPDGASADIARGFALIAALGQADVGQSAVLAQGRLLAVEAVDGTDAMLQRVAGLPEARRRGGVLVKRAKPTQELRIDLPAIGPRTVELAHAAGLSGIAVEAHRVLIADRPTVERAISATGLHVVGLVPAPAQGSPPPGAAQRFAVSGRVTARGHDAADVVVAAYVLRVLQSCVSAPGVVAARRHVMAIDVGEGIAPMLARLGGLWTWGGRGGRRRGVLGLSSIDDGTPAHIEAAAAAGLAGVLLVGAPAAWPHTVVAAADARGLFVLSG